ncbi:TonB-dependent receptor domain-containing protein [Asticcacaulis solisilvae]|uniref:TonB-dependent receptor domain-containing protein n=1 Tax=Asticcacaulis solisilvae TaxID=1217274 RepID=UPI003FD71722
MALTTGLTTGLASAAVAQTQADTADVIVTGTHIKRPNLKSSSPITTVDSKEIQAQGTTAVESVINRLPQFTPDSNDNVSGGSDGTSNVNLRGLGSNRNLVLIDGQRMLPTLAVDVNFIPSALVDRVDVVSGGASAVYGSDAVSGVVNFIMKKNLKGLVMDAQYSVNQHSNDAGYVRSVIKGAGYSLPPSNVTDGEKYYYNITFGSDFADKRGNIEAYIGYRRAAAVMQDSRDYSACSLYFPDAAGSTFACGGSGNHAYGHFDPLTGPNAGADLANAKDGSKTFVANDSSFLYNYAPTNYIQRSDNRLTSGAFLNYVLNDKAKLYGSFMYMDDHTFSQEAPSAIWLGTNFAINCDNPLMSDQQKMTLCGSTTSTADAHTLVGYRMAKGTPRRNDLRHSDFRYNIGVKGQINDGLSYDVGFMQSQMLFDSNYQNDVDQAKAGKAMQVVLVNGTPTCKSVVDGSDPACVPIDIFSSNGPSAAGYNYIYTQTFTHGDQRLSVASASLNADLGVYGIHVPWANDGVALAVGAEERDETLLFKADAQAQASGTNNADGEIKSDELYTEVNVPLVQDKPLIHELTLDAGYRVSRYQAHSQLYTAPNKNISTSKIEVQYAPNTDIRFRASYNDAIRAANIAELFAQQGLGNVSGVDPCGGAVPTASLAKCQLSGVTASQYGHIAPCPADVCVQQSGGNPALDPERAKTTTLGFVLTPQAMRRFTMSVDYYDIRVDGYISTVDPNLIINQCLQNGVAFFCQQFHRDPSSGILFGPAGYIISTNVNTGYLKTSGYDINANYNLDWATFGHFDIGFVGTYLSRKVTQPLPGMGSYDCKGLFGPVCGQPSPVWRHNARVTWALNTLPATISLNWRYYGSVALSSNTSNSFLSGVTSTLNAKIPAYNYIDLYGTWDVGHGIALRGGINNLFDKAPPAISAGLLSSFGNGNTYPGVYDPLGRMLFVGLTAKY